MNQSSGKIIEIATIYKTFAPGNDDDANHDMLARGRCQCCLHGYPIRKPNIGLLEDFILLDKEQTEIDIPVHPSNEPNRGVCKFSEPELGFFLVDSTCLRLAQAHQVADDEKEVMSVDNECPTQMKPATESADLQTETAPSSSNINKKTKKNAS